MITTLELKKLLFRLEIVKDQIGSEIKDCPMGIRWQLLGADNSIANAQQNIKQAIELVIKLQNG